MMLGIDTAFDKYYNAKSNIMETDEFIPPKQLETK